MRLVTLRALKPLSGDWGRTPEGGIFTTYDRAAEQLEARGLAERYYPPDPPKMEAPPENKMLAVPENKGMVLDWGEVRSIPESRVIRPPARRKRISFS